MIARYCFGRDWIESKRIEYGVDPILLEKCIYAFALLSNLRSTELTFIFKGGTSLLIHCPNFRRLSIDIDIITQTTQQELDFALDSISKKHPFIGIEEQDRGWRGLPHRRHFKLFYNSQYNSNLKGTHVILDVVESDTAHIISEEKAIETPLFELETDTSVQVPTKEALLSDKLVAFAPKTLGIPYDNFLGDSMQIVKQLFDVGELFNVVESLSTMKAALKSVHQIENTYHSNKYSLDEVMLDTQSAALAMSLHQLKGGITEESTFLESGVRRLAGHIVGNFRLEDAKIAAGKIAYLLSLLKREAADLQMQKIERFAQEDVVEMNHWSIEGDLNKLNKLKKINPEAFFYWYKSFAVY